MVNISNFITGERHDIATRGASMKNSRYNNTFADNRNKLPRNVYKNMISTNKSQLNFQTNIKKFNSHSLFPRNSHMKKMNLKFT